MNTSLSIAVVLFWMTSATALKHSFVANHDGRFFIGPIGIPYGFLENGIYTLNVSKFRINTGTAGSSKQKKDQTEEDIIAEMEGLHPGFLLKRFENEGEFSKFQEQILDSPTQCGFSELIDDLDERPEVPVDNNSVNGTNGDESVARGPGVVDGGADGIFLSMKNVNKMWKPNEPTVRHSFTVGESGYYFLFYQICLMVNNEKFLFKTVRSTFRLDLEYKNFDVLGKASYLTAGEMPLPHMYLYFSISYAMMLFLWVRSLKSDESRGGAKPTVYAIHHLMSSVVALKFLSVFFESVRYHFIRVNGHAELWSFVYYGLNFIKGTFLFTVVLLLGSGWSFFKASLSSKERKIIFLVFFLQVIDNIAVLVLTHETMGERLYNDWSAILHLVDIISCCAILVPIVWQVNTLEQSIEGENENGNVTGEDGEDSESSRLQAKLTLFRSFYLIVVAYIYFTRIVVYLFASTLSYNRTWLRYFVTELGTLLFYFAIGIKFMPRAENEYAEVQHEEDSEENHGENEIELGSVSKAKD